jgi:biopolymer transport protein ExbD
MASKVTLRRPARPGSLISLVPMIDVMMILLVFFMVTSTYLDLDMIPAVRQQNDSTSAASPGSTEGNTVMIRLASDGMPVIRGQALSPDALAALLGDEMNRSALTRVLVLPSGGASTQALVSVMDIATRAGVRRLRVIRLEAQP